MLAPVAQQCRVHEMRRSRESNPRSSRRAAQKRVTGGRWRRIVLGHVLAEQVVVVEEVVRVSGRITRDKGITLTTGKFASCPQGRELRSEKKAWYESQRTKCALLATPLVRNGHSPLAGE
eukprot:scaffold113631_cov66-Phaeocystis_antarctica.AAC.1